MRRNRYRRPGANNSWARNWIQIAWIIDNQNNNNEFVSIFGGVFHLVIFIRRGWINFACALGGNLTI